MGRGKLNLELIKSEKSRALTFQKRKKGLMKKAYEIDILCESEACMIIYGPKLKDKPNVLEVWPSDPAMVNAAIEKYKQKTLADVRGKKPFDLHDYYAARKRMVDEETTKLRKASVEARFPRWDDRIDDMSPDQIMALLAKLKSRIEVGKRKIAMMKADQYSCLMEDYKSAMFTDSPSTQLTHSLCNNQPQASFQKSLDVEAVGCQQQQQSQNQQHQHQHQNQQQLELLRNSYYPYDEIPQLLPMGLDVNPTDNHMMMMMMTPARTNANGADFTQFGHASSSGSANYSPLQLPVCYDRAAATLDNMMYNNPWAAPPPVGFYVPPMQPVSVPLAQFPALLPAIPSQMLPPQFNDFLRNVNEYNPTRGKKPTL